MKSNQQPELAASERTPDEQASIGRRNFLLGAGTAVAAGMAPTASSRW